MNLTLELLYGRKSVRAYEDRPVGPEARDAILKAAMRAPTAGGLMLYSIIEVDGPQAKARLAVTCDHQPFIATAPMVLLFLADYQRWYDYLLACGVEEYCQRRGVAMRGPEEGDLFLACCDALIAAQTAVIAAKSLGIDSLLTNGVHRGDMERLWVKLGLPRQYCFPLIALVLGYAAKEPPYLKGRLSGPGVVHDETFHNLTGEEADAIVRQYDDKTLHLGLNEDWDQKGHKHYLDWLHKEWLGRNRKPGETQILARLRQAGFVESAGK